jgi:ribonuclease D
LEAQGRLKALASWRERTAQTRDRPRGWIATDVQLMEIARAAPQDLEALARVPQITPPLTKTYGQEIVDTVCAAASAPTQRFWAEPRPPTPTEQMLARTLQSRIDAVAQAQGVSAGTIATRRALLEFIRDAAGPLTRGWRWELVGRELETLRNQQQTLNA